MHICKCSLMLDEAIGQCDEGKNCSECYQMLVKSLLLKDNNLFNLSKTFFPTNSDDRPQFVTITYHYKDTNETKTWYWSQKGSYFVYPLQTFEYLSLFFGKASTFFAGDVTVTLDQECINAKEEFMQHLTQQVSLILNIILCHGSIIHFMCTYTVCAYNCKVYTIASFIKKIFSAVYSGVVTGSHYTLG